MSEENKDGKTVRDLSPDKDPKGGIGTEPPEGVTTKTQLDKNTNKSGSGGPSPVPPIPGTN